MKGACGNKEEFYRAASNTFITHFREHILVEEVILFLCVINPILLFNFVLKLFRGFTI